MPMPAPPTPMPMPAPPVRTAFERNTDEDMTRRQECIVEEATRLAAAGSIQKSFRISRQLRAQRQRVEADLAKVGLPKEAKYATGYAKPTSRAVTAACDARPTRSPEKLAKLKDIRYDDDGEDASLVIQRAMRLSLNRRRSLPHQEQAKGMKPCKPVKLPPAAGATPRNVSTAQASARLNALATPRTRYNNVAVAKAPVIMPPLSRRPPSRPLPSGPRPAWM